MNLPTYWSAMPFTAKADYLVRTNQAQSFPDACAMIGGRHRHGHTKATTNTAPVAVRLPYANNDIDGPTSPPPGGVPVTLQTMERGCREPVTAGVGSRPPGPRQKHTA